MRSFIDTEFGEIIVHRRRGSRGVHIKMGADGRLVATTPLYTPLIYLKQVVNTSRDALRNIVTVSAPQTTYGDAQAIGKKHALAVVPTTMVKTPSIAIKREKLLVYLPPSYTIDSASVQRIIRDAVIKILRREAASYLPERLATFAKKHAFRYERVRFSHATGRWGSCSSTGTISLNIALMKLPDELIDYVIIHELCHTRHMNHSASFWQEVERYDPHFRLHRRQIKREHPTV